MASNDSGVDTSNDSNDGNMSVAASTAPIAVPNARETRVAALVELPIPSWITLRSDIDFTKFDLELPVFAVPLEAPIIRPSSLPSGSQSLKMTHRIYSKNYARRNYPIVSQDRNRQKLCTAASKCDLEMVRKLLDLGTDPNCSDEHKRSPLHLASCRGHFPVVSQLIRSGANPNIVDSLGNTPLHLAVISASSIDFYFVVSILLKSGANPHALDRNGKRPQELAESKLRLLQARSRTGTASWKNADQDIELLSRVLRYFDTLKYDDFDIPALEQRLQSLSTEDRISQSEADSLLANIERLSITQ